MAARKRAKKKARRPGKKKTRRTGKKKRTTKKKRATRRKVTKKKTARRKPARKKAAKRKPARKKAAKRKTTRKKATRKKKSRRKAPAGFMRPLTPSVHLAEIVGSKAIPRTEVVKKLWRYIKRLRLQDRVNRRMINADAKLKKLFGGRRQVDMFQMTKLVSKHLK